MIEVYSSYLLYKKGKYQFINGIDEFRYEFAPIDSSAKALSYAIAADNLMASFDLHLWDFSGDAIVGKIEDTYVEEKTDGYFVHLFTSVEPLCGCGIHVISSVDILIHQNGQIEELKRQPVFQVDACID